MKQTNTFGQLSKETGLTDALEITENQKAYLNILNSMAHFVGGDSSEQGNGVSKEMRKKVLTEHYEQMREAFDFATRFIEGYDGKIDDPVWGISQVFGIGMRFGKEKRPEYFSSIKEIIDLDQEGPYPIFQEIFEGVFIPLGEQLGKYQDCTGLQISPQDLAMQYWSKAAESVKKRLTNGNRHEKISLDECVDCLLPTEDDLREFMGKENGAREFLSRYMHPSGYKRRGKRGAGIAHINLRFGDNGEQRIVLTYHNNTVPKDDVNFLLGIYNEKVIMDSMKDVTSKAISDLRSMHY